MDKGGIFNLNATVHVDTSKLDADIGKANQLLALLQEVQKTAGSPDGD